MNGGRRFESLDALRGFAILGMAWSGMLPDTLPPWMYHAQWPPPDHIVNLQLFGITWVDLVFPFFLFSMGASIPLAISRRRNQGDSTKKIILGLLVRGALLYAFAVIGQQLRPYVWSSKPDAATWTIAVAGFGLLLLMFIRWPERVPKRVRFGLASLGWVGAATLISTHTFADGRHGLYTNQLDVILLVLANVSVSGGLIWMATTGHPMVRIVVMAAVALILLTANISGSVGKLIWDFAPSELLRVHDWRFGRFVPVFYHFEFQKYLLIVLPGTFCGDLILRAQADEGSGSLWTKWRSATNCALAVGVAAFVCWGLFSREVVVTSLWTAGILASLLCLTCQPTGRFETLVAHLSRWGSGLLMLGLVSEPIGGGIRKESATISYFLVTSGLAFLTLAGLEILVDIFKWKRGLRLVSQTGANPILGYLVITNLVMGVAGLVGWSSLVSRLTESPWVVAFADGGIKTLAVALITASFTRAKLFLRA